MSTHTEEFTVGVEEEYQIIHPATRELRSRASRILLKAEEAVGRQVQPELYLSQIEIGTRVCSTLVDVRAELVRLRREVITAAERDGSRIAAAGTHPFSHWESQRLTPKDRYRSIAEDYQQLARAQHIFRNHDRRHGIPPTGVEREMRNDLRNLGCFDTVLERPVQMRRQF